MWGCQTIVYIAFVIHQSIKTLTDESQIENSCVKFLKQLYKNTKIELSDTKMVNFKMQWQID